MATKIPALEQLARKEVGKPGGSPLIFVTEKGIIRAVFTATRADRDDVMESAIAFARSLPHRHPVLVEDQTGTAWENEASLRLSRVEEG